MTFLQNWVVLGAFMNKFFQFLTAGVFALAATVSADALSAKPLRIGPVQNYGALGTSNGKIVSLVNGKQVMLRGVSLFWSDATGIQYYNSEVIAWAAKNLHIDVFRFAMGIQYYDSDGNPKDPLDEAYAYMTSPDTYIAKIDQMVEAAIENDVYIIIDWHSHRAEYEQTEANAFFALMAQKYASIPNVIFEIYNEPVKTGWSTIQSYANTVSASIRQYTENLILVGTPSWSQLTSYGGVTATNVAYVFHFYAGGHPVGTHGSKLTSAINSGNAVFISEWGTTTPDGKGAPNASNTADWISFMETNKISNCNWSLRQYTSTVDDSNEGSAIFDGSDILRTQEALNNATYTASGTIVKNYLTQYASSWADSLISGNTNGSCHFNTKTVTETVGTVTNVLVSGCSYTSSDETVASVNGSSLNILSAGYAILTANDNSKSIIIVEKEPEQTANITDFTCRYGGSCTQSHMMKNYTGSSNYETLLSTTGTTTQGGTLSFTSLSPEILSTKIGTCTNSTYCYGSTLNSSLPMAEFTTALGTGMIHVTAPAVTGYRALSDTIFVTFAKGQQRISNKFKSQTLALGATSVANTLPDTTIYDHGTVSYTYNGQASSPYLTKVGNVIVAGTENAIVEIAAHADETTYYESFDMTITVIIGDSSLAVNKEEYYATPIIAPKSKEIFQAEIQNNSLQLFTSQAGIVQYSIYSATGKTILSHKANMTKGVHSISVKNIPSGSYFIKVKQGFLSKTLRWNKL